MEHIKEDNICAHHINDGSGICIPKNIIVNIHNKVINNSNKNDYNELIKELGSELSCTNDNNIELCIINKAPIDEQMKTNLKKEYLKPEGALDPVEWLNNTNIDEIQEQFYKKYPNYYYSYIHMIDFVMHPPDNEIKDHRIINIKDIDFVKELNGVDYKNKITSNNNKLKYYGVVFNTDPSHKSGQHWFSLFFNFASVGTINDPWTLEYFNSSGEDIKTSGFNDYFKKLAIEISKGTNKVCNYIRVTKLQHQNTVTGNCGCYALGYIWDRLEKIPSSKYNDPNELITDDKYVSNFRKRLFRPEENKN